MIPSTWETIVQNLGTVYKGSDEAEAKEAYDEYVELSQNGIGKVGGMTVDLLQDGMMQCSYLPPSQCRKCGKPYEVENGISNHITIDGAIDYQTDADHLPQRYYGG